MAASTASSRNAAAMPPSCSANSSASTLADASTDLPSPFGQVMAGELERALARAWYAKRAARRDPRRFELEGTHLEHGDEIRVTVIAREFGTGTLLGSAAAPPTTGLCNRSAQRRFTCRRSTRRMGNTAFA